jgi:hypothetical protein
VCGHVLLLRWSPSSEIVDILACSHYLPKEPRQCADPTHHRPCRGIAWNINDNGVSQPKRFVAWSSLTMHGLPRGRIVQKECIINEMPWFSAMTGYPITARSVELGISIVDLSPIRDAKWPICPCNDIGRGDGPMTTINCLGRELVSCLIPWTRQKVLDFLEISEDLLKRLTGTDKSSNHEQLFFISSNTGVFGAEFWKEELEF